MADVKKLLGLTFNELKGVVSELSMPAFAARQIADWLYKKKVGTIDEMTNLSTANRRLLSQQYEVGLQPHVDSRTSVDGTVKYVFPAEQNRIEAVLIPSKDRTTLCVSSQAGCRLNCAFCMTGKQGFNGQLTANDIFNQIQSVPENDQLTNIVFMGMGEPFDNTDEVMKVLEILTSSYGYAWSPKRVTVSTAGIIPGLKRFLDESDCHLAVSLHSPYHEERMSLMPVEKAYHLDSIIDLLHNYDFTHQRRVSFEYIMFDNLNDTDRHAHDLAHLLRGIECRVNLIRFHHIPGLKLHSCGERKMEMFRQILNDKGVIATVRASRGEDVFAACGMLAGKNQVLPS
ncbi:MAG: 23S rRNA (adenine(2503)-C(2))-methyltransferase RlmN [Tannerella sp.]|nr:23S rRNA (adenine(2503)-C(2))-methyltransferase RlmN [Tannerella sp.]